MLKSLRPYSAAEGKERVKVNSLGLPAKVSIFRTTDIADLSLG
jgi:hypothetical protein